MARSILLSYAFLALRVAAQTASPYTDDNSGITFNGYNNAGFRFGIALPESPTTDFIAQIVAPVNSTGGWGGFSMGSSMAGNLLVVAWPNGDEVVSSFRLATGYTSPAVTTGDFSMTTIPDGTYTNDTAFSYTFLCSNCLSDSDASTGLVLSDTSNVLGWAYSTDEVTDPTSASSALTYHSAGFGAFGLTVADAQSANYDTWAALATGSTGNSSTGGNSTTPTTGTNTTATIANATYDYIVAGAGPAGLVAAGRLAESGASVLLLERGGKSLASTGNTDALSWNSSVTMYDVPGLSYYLSTVGNVAYCTDTADQAGCLLGGGGMVNALMFVKPQERDFDDNWPQGWKWSDVAEAADRFYERNPGQTYGSMDGVRYNNQAWDVLSGFFASNGFSETDAIEKPNEKQNVFSHPPWNLADGLRSGPVKTYLPMVQDLSNFKLELNTKVIRAVRNGSTISGIETETSSGARVIYNLNAGGKVLLAAGTMSTPRILFNSGIGPTEQLQTVADGTSGVTLPAQSDWINLPVGAQIKDHPIFTIKFNTTANLSALATTEFTSPNDTSVDLFAQGSGILAQSGQRLNFWTSVNTTDGQEVFVQGTCTGPAENTIQMKIYLTHGLTSVGSLGITADGATELTSEPWMTTDTDIEAATTFMDRLLEMTRQSNSTLSFYSAGTATGSNVTGADLIKTYVTGAHYVGTAKMGTEGDEGVVVDTNTKVYGTDNLFVVDASMHPDLPTGNTQAIVMVAAEAAVAKILALGGSANGTDSSASSSALPLEVSASAVQSESPVETGTESTSTISSTPGQGQQTPQPGNNRPHGSHHRHSRNGNGGPQSLSTSTTTPQATPARIHARRHKKRQLVGRLPYGPEYADSDGEILERSQMERASFLDSAYAEY